MEPEINSGVKVELFSDNEEGEESKVESDNFEDFAYKGGLLDDLVICQLKEDEVKQEYDYYNIRTDSKNSAAYKRLVVVLNREECHKLCKELNIELPSIQQPLENQILDEFDVYLNCNKESNEDVILNEQSVDIPNFNWFECPTCLQSFELEASLKMHMMWSHSYIPVDHDCPRCEKKFTDKIEFERHVLSHDFVTCYQCKHCLLNFNSDSDLFSHLATHKLGLMSCKNCSQVFTSKRELALHTRTHGKFPCGNCDQVFTTMSLLKHHLLLQCTNGKSTQCTVCDRTFSAQILLHIHMLQHAGDTELSCEQCSLKFKSKSELEEHSFTHSFIETIVLDDDPSPLPVKKNKSRRRGSKTSKQKETESNQGWNNTAKPYTCEICSKSFTRRSNFRGHLAIHTYPFKCQFCDSRYETKLLLNQHLLTHESDNSLRCRHCFIEFESKWDLLTHIQQTHPDEVLYKCEICEQQFQYKKMLRKHIVTNHFNESVYFCETCNEGFCSTYRLIQHVLSQKCDEETYKCQYCLVEFSRRVLLDQHLLLHTEKNLHFCVECGKQFYYKLHYDQHVMKHYFMTKYQCPICSKIYYRESVFNKHVLLHSEKKRSECQLCGQTFTRKASMFRHLLRHTKKKLFECEICDKKFGTKNYLNSHMLVHNQSSV